MRSIELTQGLYTIVDDEDYEWLSQFKWCAANEGKNTPLFYAVSKIRKQNVRMHRLILGVSKGTWVDHKNRNSLDNRKENLRVTTPQNNARNKRVSSNNSLGVKGVNYHQGAYCARIWYKGRNVHLGRFETLLEAQLAYDFEALKLFGKYAATNSSLGLLKHP